MGRPFSQQDMPFAASRTCASRALAPPPPTTASASVAPDTSLPTASGSVGDVPETPVPLIALLDDWEIAPGLTGPVMPVAVEPPEGLSEASFVPDSGEGIEPPPCPL